MRRVVRVTLVLLLVSCFVVVVPGDAPAAIPGDIGRIVFLSDVDHPSAEIYIRGFDGNTPIRLTSNTDAEYTPVWSPDGTRIAFSRPIGGVTDVYVMDPDGSNELNLTNGVGMINAPLDWSPDGTRILFASDRGGNRDLWTMYPDGSDPQQLTNTTDIEWSASWSSDGSLIATDRLSGGNTDIWVMNADGAGATRITNTTDNETDPVWSPDGTRIAYVSDYSGTDVWVMNADGSNQINLTNSALWSSWEPAWAPDGSRLAYTSDRDGDLDIWMMNLDGSGQAHLTDNPADERAVSFESVNRDPVAVDDEAQTIRGGSVAVDVLANDSDPDGEPLEIADVTIMPAVGSVAVAPSGSITYTHDGSPPLSAYPFGISFEYEVLDSRMGSARANVTVWVTGEVGFDDVPAGHLFFDDIMWLASQGITKGCNPPENTLFCPADPVTRGQMAAFLVRARGYVDDGGGDLFIDDNGSVFEADIDRLGTAGVTRGCNPPINDRFCPGEVVTRGQMAAFLARAYNLSAGGLSDLFADDDGSVFESDIDKLGATGVSKGCNPPVNDMFCPVEPVTRQQMAAFIHRAAT